jgi:phosphate ABC transporter permease protein PstC
MASVDVAAEPVRRPLLQQQGTASRLADPVLKNVLAGLAVGILVLIAYFFGRLLVESRPAFAQTSVLDFVFSNDWVPSQQAYGAAPLVVGTLITSAIALIIGVPVAVASAIYVTELAPPRVRQPLTILVELLAAVPSVVYGLWGIFFLAPKLQGFETFVNDKLSFVPFVGGGDVSIPNYFIAGLILAIMIVPIVSAISREVMATVPKDHKEAALALGATRWEMIRVAVLPYSRGGITGAAMLGLGRAIGETIAVTIVIGNAAVIGNGLFTQGYSLAAVIANEFGEAASDPVHRASLIAAGLVLFVLTLVVNLLARYLVHRSDRKLRGEGSPVVTPPTDAVGAAGGAA